MQRQEALNRLRKILGNKLGYRVDPDAPSQEERDHAREAQAGLTAARVEAEKAMQERQRVLLQDAEYQRLKQAWKEAREAAAKNAGLAMRFKFTVGVSNDLFFHVKAQGDSWEEIFAKLKAE